MTLAASSVQLHSHRNTSELLPMEILEAQRGLAVTLYRTFKYNEVSSLVDANVLWGEVSILDHGLHVVEIAISERDVGQRDENKGIIG